MAVLFFTFKYVCDFFLKNKFIISFGRRGNLYVNYIELFIKH